MMKKNFIRSIAIAVISVLVSLTSLSHIHANASEIMVNVSQLGLSKDNITYIKGKIGDIDSAYTYTSNNKIYKVVEKASENFNKVDSIIYVQNGQGQFDEYANQKLRVEDNRIVITTVENGLNTTDQIDLNQPNQMTNIQQPSSIYDAPTWAGMPVTGWIHYHTFYGSNNFTRYTSAAVIAILSTAAASFFGIAGQTVVAGVAAVAGVIVEDHIDTVYWTNWSYYQTVIPDDPAAFRNKVVEMDSIYYYSDSARTDYIGHATYTHYDFLYEQ